MTGPSQRRSVLAAVSINGDALADHPEYWGDFDVVLAAARNSGLSVRMARPELRDNIAIAMAVVNENPNAIMFLSDRLRNHHEVALAAVRRNGYCLFHVGHSLRDDRQIVEAAVATAPTSVRWAAHRWRDSQELGLALVRQCPGTLEYLSDRLRNEQEVVTAAVEAAPLSLCWAGQTLCSDAAFVAELQDMLGPERQSELPLPHYFSTCPELLQEARVAHIKGD